MRELFAQGDLLIERVHDREATGRVLPPAADGAHVLAEGELTGHRHAIHEQVVMFRDDGLARDIPADLYIGHVRVGDEGAKVIHQEHAPIELEKGTYRLRRQRELGPAEARVVLD